MTINITNRIYLRIWNPAAINIGAFYSTKWSRWYVQIVPMLLCVVVVIGERRNPPEWEYEIVPDVFGDQ